MTTHTAPGFTLTGRKVLAIFVLFFGTIFAADTILLVMAVKSFSGMETSSSYKAGQLYNGELAKAREQEGLGWSLKAAATREADGWLRIGVDLKDSSGAALTGRRLTVSLNRPTDRREDRGADLVEETVGLYGARIDNVAAGQWDLVVDVLNGDERVFRRHSRVILP